MANTTNELTKARVNKKDEFYTSYEDIALEMPYYKEYLYNKTIFLPCDDSSKSAFFRYFKDNFNEYHLKKLISIGYTYENYSHKTEYDGINQIDIPIDSNGDFRNPISIKLMKESDVIITNPPFSLFTDFVKQLNQYNKKFIILGNINSITTNVVWDMVKCNKLWLGKTIHSNDRKFYIPDDYELSAWECGIDNTGKRFISVKGVRWFTNIEYNEMYQDFQFSDNTDRVYETYDNYPNAINVAKCKYIPDDYYGEMGVPITFIDKYNPAQFKIIDIDKNIIGKRFKLNGKTLYARIIIQRI